jgi:hypothetical protein
MFIYPVVKEQRDTYFMLLSQRQDKAIAFAYLEGLPIYIYIYTYIYVFIYLFVS